MSKILIEKEKKYISDRIPYSNETILIEKKNKKFNGIYLSKNFLDKEVLNKINEEIDQLIDKPVCNSNIRGSIIDNSVLKQISIPSLSIESSNILEIACLVFDELKNLVEVDDYIVTNIQIFSEKNNNKPLNWHTDNRQGMYRAQIYLKGGNENSGGFLYMKGTNNINHEVKHALSNQEIVRMNSLVVDCSGNEGDLIIFDSYGFHGKYPCPMERRTIMFEFQHKHSDYIKSSVIIDNKKLSKKVIDNLQLFSPGNKKNYKGHGLDNFNNYNQKLIFFQKKTIVFLTKYFELISFIKRLIPSRIKFFVKKLLNFKV